MQICKKDSFLPQEWWKASYELEIIYLHGHKKNNGFFFLERASRSVAQSFKLRCHLCGRALREELGLLLMIRKGQKLSHQEKKLEGLEERANEGLLSRHLMRWNL